MTLLIRLSNPRCPRRMLLLVCATVTSVLLLVACVNVNRADAGTYLMRSCNVPGEHRAPAAPWRWVHTAGTYANDECASGGGFGLNTGVMQRASAAAVLLARPTEGPQSVIAIRRVRLWMIARLGGSGSALFVAMSSGDSKSTVAQDIFGPPGGDTLTAPYVSPTLLSDTALFSVVLSCSGSAPDGCTPTSINPLEIRGAEVTLFEDMAPAGMIDGEKLLGKGPQAGTRSISYVANDHESGVAQVSLLVGTTAVASQDFEAECPHSDFAACLQSRTGILQFDTRKVPDGSYPVSLRVTDAAGNREVIQAADPILIANGESGHANPNGDGATANAKLLASFVGSRKSTTTVPYGRSGRIRGRLTNASGKAIANATVEVTETPVLRHARTGRRSVITRANGMFSYRFARRGTSRRIGFQYRSTLGSPNVAASRQLRLNVAAAGILRVALRGVKVRYTGIVRTRPIPTRGKLVYVEGRAAGGAWTRFAVRRTNRSGIFSGFYRLRVHRPGVRLQFRIQIPTENGYPYVTGTSRSVARTVR
jgi:hypothetical protein